MGKPYLYTYCTLAKLFAEHADPQLLADQVQTLFYFCHRDMAPATLKALEEERQSKIRLKLALRETKPVK
jgi:hypothetical protein